MCVRMGYVEPVETLGFKLRVIDSSSVDLLQALQSETVMRLSSLAPQRSGRRASAIKLGELVASAVGHTRDQF